MRNSNRNIKKKYFPSRYVKKKLISLKKNNKKVVSFPLFFLFKKKTPTLKYMLYFWKNNRLSYNKYKKKLIISRKNILLRFKEQQIIKYRSRLKSRLMYFKRLTRNTKSNKNLVAKLSKARRLVYTKKLITASTNAGLLLNNQFLTKEFLIKEWFFNKHRHRRRTPLFIIHRAAALYSFNKHKQTDTMLGRDFIIEFRRRWLKRSLYLKLKKRGKLNFKCPHPLNSDSAKQNSTFRIFSYRDNWTRRLSTILKKQRNDYSKVLYYSHSKKKNIIFKQSLKTLIKKYIRLVKGRKEKFSAQRLKKIFFSIQWVAYRRLRREARLILKQRIKRYERIKRWRELPHAFYKIKQTVGVPSHIRQTQLSTLERKFFTLERDNSIRNFKYYSRKTKFLWTWYSKKRHLRKHKRSWLAVSRKSQKINMNNYKISAIISNSRSNYFLTLVHQNNPVRVHMLKMFSSGQLKLKTAKKRRDIKAYTRLVLKLIRFLQSRRVTVLNQLIFKLTPNIKFRSSITRKHIKTLTRMLKIVRIKTIKVRIQTLIPHGQLPRFPKRRRK